MISHIRKTNLAFHCLQALTRGGVSFKGESWHRECFVCEQCRQPLAGVKFTLKYAVQESAIVLAHSNL